MTSISSTPGLSNFLNDPTNVSVRSWGHSRVRRTTQSNIKPSEEWVFDSFGGSFVYHFVGKKNKVTFSVVKPGPHNVVEGSKVSGKERVG